MYILFYINIYIHICHAFNTDLEGLSLFCNCNRLQQTATDCNTLYEYNSPTYLVVNNNRHIHFCCACIHSWESLNNSFHWKCYTPDIHQIEKLRFLGISRYKFKLRFWFDLNLYRGIWVSRFSELWECSIYSGNCHIHSFESLFTSIIRLTFQRAVSHISMSHVTYQRVVWHISMRHVTYQWGMSHIEEACHISMSHVAYQWVMAHIESKSFRRHIHPSCVCVHSLQTWRVSPCTSTHCNTLQHAATHCNTLQHTATHNESQICLTCRTAKHCNTLQHAATYWNTKGVSEWPHLPNPPYITCAVCVYECG